MFIICWILPYLLYPHPNPLALVFFFLQTKRHHGPLKTLPCKHTNHLHACAQLGKHWPSTLHWVREWWWFRSAWWSLSWKCEGDKIKIAIRRVGIEHGVQSEWERVKSRRVQRETAEHEAAEQRTGGVGGDSFSSRATASSQTQHWRIWTGSLTDLAVAEMYWTTISRLVLRSFSRSGALRSSFRFMSSWRHKGQGESLIDAREAAWMENLLQNCFILLMAVLTAHGVDLKQKQMCYTIMRTHFQFIWIHSQDK